MSTITTFTYDIDELLTRIKTESLYIARNISVQNGSMSLSSSAGYTHNITLDGDQLDKWGITENDEVYVQKLMRAAGALIFDKWLSPQVRTLTEDEMAANSVGAYQFDSEDNPDKIIFAMKTDDLFDINTVPAIDVAIEELIVNYVIWQWFLKSALVMVSPQLLNSLEQQYISAANNLGGLVSRRITYKRTYKFY